MHDPMLLGAFRKFVLQSPEHFGGDFFDLKFRVITDGPASFIGLLVATVKRLRFDQAASRKRMLGGCGDFGDFGKAIFEIKHMSGICNFEFGKIVRA